MKLTFTKSLFFIIGACALLFSFTSCTREFTCQCYISYSGKPGLPDTLLKEYPITDSKKNAEKLCKGQSGTYEKDGITTVEDCNLW